MASNSTTTTTNDLSSHEDISGESNIHTAHVESLVLETTTKEAPDFGPAPDGGTRAWLAAAGGAAFFFCTLGYANSFGAFQAYYLTHQLKHESPSDVAWIGSTAVFLALIVGLVAGPLIDRFGTKVTRPAAVLYIFVMMMLSLCETYWQFMLVQGVFLGCLMGVLQLSAFAVTSQYFDKRRAAALGIVVAGSSLGGVVLPLAVSKMLNDSTLGFAWSVRVMAFVLLPVAAFGSLLVVPRLPPRKTHFWPSSGYKDARFILVSIALIFMFFGMFFPFFYLPSVSMSKGMDATTAGYQLAIMNAASIFGRVIPGILADKYGRFNIFALGGFCTGIVTFLLNEPSTTAGLVVYTVFLGFASGTIISGGSAALSVCVDDPRNIAGLMGMGMAIAGIGALIGPPLNGQLIIAYHGSYFEAAMLSGAMCIVGAMIAYAGKLRTPQGFWGVA